MSRSEPEGIVKAPEDSSQSKSSETPNDLEILAFDAMERVAVPRLKEGAYKLASTTLVICGETRPFRFLAKHLEMPEVAEEGSCCLDLGCSTGETTSLLAKRFSRVIGVDVSEEVVSNAKVERPTLDLRLFDVLADRDKLNDVIMNELGRVPVFFVDIGGDRMQDIVVLFLSHIIKKYSPSLIVVKSRKLYRLVIKKGLEQDQKHWAAENWITLVEQISEEELKDRKCFHPQRYPLRLVPNTERAICRYYSYVGVCKKGDECEQDHDHCHHCLEKGHRALDCSILASELIVRKRKS